MGRSARSASELHFLAPKKRDGVRGGQVFWLTGQPTCRAFPVPEDQWRVRRSSPITATASRPIFTAFPLRPPRGGHPPRGRHQLRPETCARPARAVKKKKGVAEASQSGGLLFQYSVRLDVMEPNRAEDTPLACHCEPPWTAAKQSRCRSTRTGGLLRRHNAAPRNDPRERGRDVSIRYQPSLLFALDFSPDALS